MTTRTRTRSPAFRIALLWAAGGPVILGGLTALALAHDALPAWARVLVVVGVLVTSVLVGATTHRELDRGTIRRIQRLLAARDYPRAAVEIRFHVREVEELSGPLDPLAARWRITLAEVYGELGLLPEALEELLLARCAPTDTRPDLDLRGAVDRARYRIAGGRLAEPVETWWRPE